MSHLPDGGHRGTALVGTEAADLARRLRVYLAAIAMAPAEPDAKGSLCLGTLFANIASAGFAAIDNGADRYRACPQASLDGRFPTDQRVGKR